MDLDLLMAEHSLSLEVDCLVTLAELRALATIQDGPHLRFQPPYRQMSVTRDEAEFLYALVRALKPRNVLELGTGLGLSAFFIASALRDNGEGFLYTVEPLPDHAAKAAILLKGMPVSVTLALGEVSRTDGDFWPDLVYIDSGERYRSDDIKSWMKIGYTGLVLVHDAERQYPELQAGVGVYLPTANGMWLGRSRNATEA